MNQKIILIQQQKSGRFHDKYFMAISMNYAEVFTKCQYFKAFFFVMSSNYEMKSSQYQGYAHLRNEHVPIRANFSREIVDIENQHPHCMRGQGGPYYWL